MTAHAVDAGVLFASETVGDGGVAVELLLGQHYVQLVRWLLKPFADMSTFLKNTCIHIIDKLKTRAPLRYARASA